MAQRDDLFQKFGPILLEAIVRITVEDLNRIRVQVGMPQITETMFLEQINNDLSHLEPYDWMNEEGAPPS